MKSFQSKFYVKLCTAGGRGKKNLVEFNLFWNDSLNIFQSPFVLVIEFLTFEFVLVDHNLQLDKVQNLLRVVHYWVGW